MIRIIKKLAIVIIIIAAVLTITTIIYMQQSKFGKSPSGERLERIKRSPNFKDGKFKNLKHTPQLVEGYSMAGVLYNYLIKRLPNRKPIDTIPSVKTDLLHLSIDQDVLVWFGHSSYFIQLHGKRILVDPVFSGNASPIAGTNKSFKGTDIYTVDDLPTIDYLFISHDHYDHLDYETILKLKTKTKQVICGLGVGSHFEAWGYSKEMIVEKDWYDTINLDSGFTATVMPARHFAGRGLSRDNTLWCSYVLKSPSLTIYIGGDSGYDTHFATIGEKFGPVDLAILDNGQYNEAWRYIHTLPGEVLQAAKDLKAKRLFPVHSSKFVLGNHPWDEPLKTITELNKQTNIPLVTPLIGEMVNLQDSSQVFKQWWLTVK